LRSACCKLNATISSSSKERRCSQWLAEPGMNQIWVLHYIEFTTVFETMIDCHLRMEAKSEHRVWQSKKHKNHHKRVFRMTRISVWRVWMKSTLRSMDCVGNMLHYHLREWRKASFVESHWSGVLHGGRKASDTELFGTAPFYSEDGCIN
jgi:hypothetical protein